MKSVVSFIKYLLILSCIGATWTSTLAQQQYKILTKDGAWCWFSDPRAVLHNDIIYAGWVSADGSVIIGSYNTKNNIIKTSNIAPQFDQDDHANPSILILPDHRIMVFFSAHSTVGNGESESGITYLISKNPGDITQWNRPQRIIQNAVGPMKFCYTNPIMLSEENNRIYLFWRGGNWKPTFCFSDDMGQTWSKVFTLIHSNFKTHKRPYIKITSNGKDEIHFAFTDGHPREEALNSIYYLKYKKGAFYKADGTQIGTIDMLPIAHEKCDVVYDAPQYYKENSYGIRAWIWDIALDSTGHPVLAYTKLPTESEHQYWYATWNHDTWHNYKISDAGSWFPRYPRTKSMREPEPHYSGGIYLDHEHTNVVYYSRPIEDTFEIFRSITKDGGKSWDEIPITQDSHHDNVRPFALRDAYHADDPQVLWMQIEHYTHYTDFQSQIRMDIPR